MRICRTYSKSTSKDWYLTLQISLTGILIRTWRKLRKGGWIIWKWVKTFMLKCWSRWRKLPKARILSWRFRWFISTRYCMLDWHRLLIKFTNRYCLRLIITRASINFIPRNHKSWTHYYPSVKSFIWNLINSSVLPMTNNNQFRTKEWNS